MMISLLAVLWAYIILLTPVSQAMLFVKGRNEDDIRVFNTASYFLARQEHYTRNGTLYIPQFTTAAENDTTNLGEDVGPCRLIPPVGLEEPDNTTEWTIALIPNSLTTNETAKSDKIYRLPKECLGYRRIIATLQANASAFTSAGLPPLGGIIFISQSYEAPGGPTDPYCLSEVTGKLDLECDMPPKPVVINGTRSSDPIPVAFLGRKHVSRLYDYIYQMNGSPNVLLVQESGPWNEYYESVLYAIRLYLSLILRASLALYAIYRLICLALVSVKVFDVRYAVLCVILASLALELINHLDSPLIGIYKYTLPVSEMMLSCAIAAMIFLWCMQLRHFSPFLPPVTIIVLGVYMIIYLINSIWLMASVSTYMRVETILVAIRAASLGTILLMFLLACYLFSRMRKDMVELSQEWELFIRLCHLMIVAILAWTVFLIKDTIGPRTRDDPRATVALTCSSDAVAILLYIIFLFGLTDSPQGDDRKSTDPISKLRLGFFARLQKRLSKSKSRANPSEISKNAKNSKLKRRHTMPARSVAHPERALQHRSSERILHHRDSDRTLHHQSSERTLNHRNSDRTLHSRSSRATFYDLVSIYKRESVNFQQPPDDLPSATNQTVIEQRVTDLLDQSVNYPGRIYARDARDLV